MGVGSALLLSGCSAIQVGLGMKLKLEKLPVTTMEATLPNNPGIAPGEKSPLVVNFTASDGKTYVTEGKGGGKVMWKDLVVTASVVSANKKGVLKLPYDPRVSDGKTGHVMITAPSHPELHAEMDIPLRYNVSFKADYSGAKGSDGLNGQDGQNGSDGSMGSTDPNNPSPGGNGGDGTDGGNGEDGGAGGDASPVQVQVTLRQGAHPLLQASVSAPGHKTHYYLIDPQGGSLNISAEGGAGGSGGRGGRGGSGGAGGIGTPNGSSGRSGSDGRAGFDGSSGRDGKITVIYDPQVQPYLSLIHLARSSVTPVWTQAPVAPLW